MFNINYAEQARLCQRIKFDQALYVLTMYQKKIRKPLRGQNMAFIDAQAQMQDIICHWKVQWKNDLTKPILNCVTSVHPRILIDRQKQQGNYNQLVMKFLHRLRTQHQDQTNFKLVLFIYDRNVQCNSNEKHIACSKAAVKSFLSMAYNLSSKFVESIQNNSQIINNQMLEVNTESKQWQVWNPLKFIKQISRKALYGQDCQMQAQQQQDNQPKCQIVQNLVAFSINVTRIMQRVKESQFGSTMITVQPKIAGLAALLHPLFVCIASTFKKQSYQKIKDFDWLKVPVESIPMMDNNKGSYNCSKIAFINLDGYESQFNLDYARNFKRQLLYISFPKQSAKLDQTGKIYSTRFFKKLMFRYTQSLYQSFGGATSQDYQDITKLQRLNYNPQDYHIHNQKLWEHPNDKSNQDFNQNIYVFPIRMSILFSKFPQILQAKDDIQNHQSLFVRFILRDFLFNQIRQFSPTMILVSYSGRVRIMNNHFVQIIQELTKISNYKVILYPNLTTAFLSQQTLQVEDQQGNTCEYDNIPTNSRPTQQLLLSQDFQSDHEAIKQLWLQLFDKMARFLKVSSGTYNLNRNYQQQPLVNKYKNQFILSYVDQLMTVLGKQYPNIERIRFKNRDLSILPKLYEDTVKNIKKIFENIVPKLYLNIYDIIQYVLFDRQLRQSNQKQKLIQQLQIKIDDYSQIIQRIKDDFQSKCNFQVVAINLQSMQQEIQRQKTKKMRQAYNYIRQTHYFQIVNEMYKQKAIIYIKTILQHKQYDSITDDKNSLNGLYDCIFVSSQTKNQLKIFESTSLLYKINQIQRKSNKIPLLIMNNLTQNNPGQNIFKNYYCQIQISNIQQGGQIKIFQQKKCTAYPLIFQGQTKQNQYLLVDWNYHETQDFIILFWPTKYDFVKAFLLRIQNKPYHPQILQDIYIVPKQNINLKQKKQVIFKKINFYQVQPISPRMGVSCYDYCNKLFIFGGFYQRQKNYLQLQNDIVSMDLNHFITTGESKVILENLKTKIYSRQNLQERLKQKQKNNSLIRPKIQFQFFQKHQIFPDFATSQGKKTVIMIGGYGQNFIRPLSLLTYYYYQLQFSQQQRSLISVQKQLIYNKATLVNTKHTTKNLGVIKTHKKKGNVLQSNYFASPYANLYYRNVFKCIVKDNIPDFCCKTKFCFTDQDSLSIRPQLKQRQELKNDQCEGNTVTIQCDHRNKHVLWLEKDGKRKKFSIKLQISSQKRAKLGLSEKSKQIYLTHQSIIHISVLNSSVSALIKHSKYTQNKTILAEQTILDTDSRKFESDSSQHIFLTPIRQMQSDLSLHIIITCNKTTRAILHGIRLSNSQKLQEFILKKKKNKNNEYSSYNITPLQKIYQNISHCFSAFFRNKNKILCVDILQINSSYHHYIVASELDLNSSNDVYKWQPSLDRFDPSFIYQISIKNSYFVKLEQIKFLDFYRSSTNQYFIIVQLNRKKLLCEIHRNSKIIQLVEQSSIKLDIQNMQKGIILSKSKQKYIDKFYY